MLLALCDKTLFAPDGGCAASAGCEATSSAEEDLSAHRQAQTAFAIPHI